MKYCIKCGAECSYESLICDKCKAYAENTVNIENSDLVLTEGKVTGKNKKKIFILICIILILAVIGTGIYFAYAHFLKSPVDKLNTDELKIYNALTENEEKEYVIYSCGKIHKYGEDGPKDGEDSDGLYPTFIMDTERFNEYCYAELKVDGDRDIYLVALDSTAMGMTVTYDVMAAVVVEAMELDVDYDSYSQLALAFEKMGYDRWYVNPGDNINAKKINSALEEYYNK